MHSLAIQLHAAAVVAPGFSSLAELRAAARSGQRPATPARLELPSPQSLPPTERRRASQVVRLALSCIERVLRESPFAVESLRSVFATDEGSGEISQQMLEALATTRQVSPLLFTNSVINAASGYFSIARRNREPATVISMGTESFAGGLLCAASEAETAGQPVLLVAYDAVMSAPMDELLPLAEPCASAWIISAAASTDAPSLGSFALRCDASAEAATAPPGWLPQQASAQSSSAALAALGLLEAGDDGVCRWPLGGVMLTLRRIPGPPS
jgi:hypothetical protein